MGGFIHFAVKALVLIALLAGSFAGIWTFMSKNSAVDTVADSPKGDTAIEHPKQESVIDQKQSGLSKKDAFFQESALQSGIDFQMNFLPEEQGAKFKINLYDHGCGVAIDDYDGDGLEDVYFVNQLGKNALYKNKGDGTFQNMAAEAGVEMGDRICVSAVFADYDNDGRRDLFVTSVRGGNVLFKNEGKGKFRDITKEAGLNHVGHCQSGHFFDYDNDGKLDLLVTCSAKWTLADLDQKQKYYPGRTTYFELIGCEIEHNLLYHNNGNGTFSNVTEKSGLKGLGWASDSAIIDFDGDGHLDILITNMFGRSQLMRNQGNGSFVDSTREALGKISWGAMGAHPLDFNNDGKLDIFIVDMHSDMWLTWDKDLSTVKEKSKNRFVTGPLTKSNNREEIFASVVKLRYDEVVFGNTFFKNLGGGKFREMSDSANLESWWPWGIAVADFNCDGYEDLFVPAGMGFPFGYWPNALMMNNGNETFSNRAVEMGIEPVAEKYWSTSIGTEKAARSSRAAAIADFDRDGRQDFMVSNFNERPYYFRNQGPKGHYASFRLTGTKSNRDAIGAVARLYVGNQVMTRQVNSACGYVAQSSKILHFGLGKNTQVDRVEITWPSGVRQTIPSPKIDSLLEVTEPQK